jgi:zinc/manganese transport system permease protein
VSTLGSPLFAQGFFTSSEVHTALAIGLLASVVSGVVGVFTVVRGQAFAGHALADIGASGGSAAFLAGVSPLAGFLAAGLGAAGVMDLIGIERPRGRDLATGIVLAASLGLAALFLYLVATYRGTTGASVTVLFGSLFTVDPSTIPAVLVLSVIALGVVLTLQRPLLLSSLSPELAAARGVHVRLVSAVYLLTLAVAAALSALTIGAILGTALLIGPAASALRLTDRPGRAFATAAALGALTTLLAIVLAYDSYDWPPHGNGWPVSFFVVTLTLLAYLASGFAARRRRPGRASAAGAAGRHAGGAEG